MVTGFDVDNQRIAQEQVKATRELVIELRKICEVLALIRDDQRHKSTEEGYKSGFAEDRQ